MKRSVTHAQVSQCEAINKKKKTHREKVEAEIRRLEAIRNNNPFTHPNPDADYLLQNINLLKRSIQPRVDIDDEPKWFTKRIKKDESWSPTTAEETEEVLRLLKSVKTPPPADPLPSTWY
ncbi:unnamed protein product [Schistosoma margrebowiei]|nr:unnamed protein product [Schistosoma margrebowiei]